MIALFFFSDFKFVLCLLALGYVRCVTSPRGMSFYFASRPDAMRLMQ
jgi:hypothetical protein